MRQAAATALQTKERFTRRRREINSDGEPIAPSYEYWECLSHEPRQGLNLGEVEAVKGIDTATAAAIASWTSKLQELLTKKIVEVDTDEKSGGKKKLGFGFPIELAIAELFEELSEEERTEKMDELRQTVIFDSFVPLKTGSGDRKAWVVEYAASHSHCLPLALSDSPL